MMMKKTLILVLLALLCCFVAQVEAKNDNGGGNGNGNGNGNSDVGSSNNGNGNGGGNGGGNGNGNSEGSNGNSGGGNGNSGGGNGGGNGNGGGGPPADEEEEEQLEISDQTCNKIRDQDVCEETGCFYCDKQKCRTSEDRCPNASMEGTCNPVKDQEFCEEIDCFWCEEKQKCRVSEDRCPGDDDELSDAPSDVPSIAPSTFPVDESLLSERLCNPIKDQDVCEETGCFYCDKQKCRTSEARCPNASREGTCNPIKDQEFCEEIDCFWCEEAQKCRVSEERCPGDELSDAPSDTPSQAPSTVDGSLPLEDENEDEDETEEPVTDPEPDTDTPEVSEGLCNPIKDQDVCEETGCFYCDKQKCRTSEARCPPASDEGTCNPIKDQEFCEEIGCFYCEEAQKCRVSEERCPAGEDEDEEEEEVSDAPSGTPSASFVPTAPPSGSSAPSLSSAPSVTPPFDACSLYTSDGACTLGPTTNCRWCPVEEECKHAGESCADGGRGIIGNPCKYAFMQGRCTEIEGCLWCEENSKCKKADDGCDEDDEDVCDPLSFEPDCAAESSCQWCSEQANCKPSGMECDTPSDCIELDIDPETPGFTLQNDGLGDADPNAVTVALNYLLEIGADGNEVPSSMVDVSSQEFSVTQSEGIHLGVLSRKVTFTVEIDGVGTIELIVYLMLEDGTLTTPAGEEFEVDEGDVKFNINLSDWTFTDTGSAFVDIAMTIEGSAESPEEDSDDSSTFMLGGGVPLIISSQVEVDGVSDAMPEGYPQLETTEDGTVFVFRFPVFSETLVYDPIVGTGALVVTSDAQPEPLAEPALPKDDTNSGLRAGGDAPTSGTPEVAASVTVSGANAATPTLLLLVACLVVSLL